MSIFTGKCDFYDLLAIYEADDTYFQNHDIYIHKNNRDHKLDIKNLHDAIKYYPYLTVMSGGCGHNGFVVLGSDDYITISEEESLESYLNDIIREWKRCKRNKKIFDKDEVYKKITWLHYNQKPIRELIDRVASLGVKATIDDIHTRIAEFHRKEWYEYMINNEYSESEAYTWVYKELFFNEEKRNQRLNNGKLIKEEDNDD